MKRIVHISLSLPLILLFLITVSANSALRYWDGSDTYGVMVTDGECPLTVLHEDLTFHINEYPESYYEDADAFLKLDSTVTAAYTIHNPSDMTVHAEVVFPFGSAPFYMPHDQGIAFETGMDAGRSTVSVNGSEINADIRYTFGGSGFEIGRDLFLLQDELREDSFYKPDLPVHEYVYRVNGVEEKETAAAMKRTVRFEQTRTKVTMDPLSGGKFGSEETLLHTWVSDGMEYRFYVFGEAPEEMSEWTVYRSGTDEEIAGEAELIREEEYDFLEYAMRMRGDEEIVSETDWFNALVSYMTYAEHGSGVPEVSKEEFERLLMRWCRYEISAEPGETLLNEVTVPLYPDIDGAFEDPKYTYKYLLSPAETWKEFGSLDVMIESDYVLLASAPGPFEKQDGAYHLSLPQLPDSELEFTLCRIENPRHVDNGYGTLIFGILAAAAVLFILLAGVLIVVIRKIMKAVFR